MYCLGVDAVCEVSIRCNILFTNHVSRMKERDIIQKIIETSQTASMPRQYAFIFELTFGNLLAPSLAGVRVAEEDVRGGAVVVVAAGAVEALHFSRSIVGGFK